MALIWLLACNPGTPCESDAACPLGQMCFDKVCVDVECTTNTDCPIGEHCDTARTCQPGCESDDDCYPGDVCSNGWCDAAECVETHEDCGWREVCTDQGCVDAGDPHCLACGDDDDCTNGVCWSGYCGVYCDTRDDCPAGFDCADVGGSVEALVCVSACWQH